MLVTFYLQDFNCIYFFTNWITMWFKYITVQRGLIFVSFGLIVDCFLTGDKIQPAASQKCHRNYIEAQRTPERSGFWFYVI